MISDGELESRVKAAVDSRIDQHFKTFTGDAKISEAINAAILQGFEHEYCRVDGFGRRNGEPTTIRKELERVICWILE